MCLYVAPRERTRSTRGPADGRTETPSRAAIRSGARRAAPRPRPASGPRPRPTRVGRRTKR
ncbi:hypothetical protein EXE46_09715 [Halorubrum sp. GN11_10-6_MGM]|nr:hypothetical protein EXE46_09715 [Halorubrum sp. GN11_10-6_MGM]